MIELFEQNIRTNDRQSSKGNQLKWENKGIWYKADYTGYEGLAEYMISHLLKKSTLAENEFTCYDLEKIKYGTVIYNGVKSKNFLSSDCLRSRELRSSFSFFPIDLLLIIIFTPPKKFIFR